MLETSETLNEIGAALNKVQAEMGIAVKDTNNPYFKSKYADYASCWEAVQGPMAANGLSTIQVPSAEILGDIVMVTVTNRILHKSGEWVQGKCFVPPGKIDAQAYGSAITYGRRYILSGMLGIVCDDDDGEGAMNRGKESPAAETDSQKKPKATEAGKPGQKTASGSSRKPEKLTGEARMKDMAKFLIGLGAGPDNKREKLSRDEAVARYNFILCHVGQAMAEPLSSWEEITEDESIDTGEIKKVIDTFVNANKIPRDQVLRNLQVTEGVPA